MHAEGGAVDVGFAAGVAEFFPGGGDDFAGGIGGVEFLGEGCGFFGGAVVDDDGGAVGGEAGDDGAGGSAGAEDGDAFFCEGVAVAVVGGGEGVECAGVVGVEGAEFSVGVPEEGVDDADVLGEGVDGGVVSFCVAHGVFCVGDGDAESAEVHVGEGAHCVESGGECFVGGLDGEGDIDAGGVHRVEAGVVDVGAEAVGDGPADDAEGGGVGLLGIPAVAGAEFVDGGLAGGAFFAALDGGEGEGGVEFFGEEAGELAFFAHGQSEEGARVVFGEIGGEAEGVKGVLEGFGFPGDFEEACGLDGAEAGDALEEVFGAAVEGVIGEDQAGAELFGGVFDRFADGAAFFPGDEFDINGVGAGFHGVFPHGDTVGIRFLGEAAFPRGADGDDDGELREVDGFEHLLGGGGVAAEFEQAVGAVEGVLGGGDGFFEIDAGLDEDGDADGGHFDLAFFGLGALAGGFSAVSVEKGVSFMFFPAAKPRRSSRLTSSQSRPSGAGSLGVSRIFGTSLNRASWQMTRKPSRPTQPRPMCSWRSTRLPSGFLESLRCQTLIWSRPKDWSIWARTLRVAASVVMS